MKIIQIIFYSITFFACACDDGLTQAECERITDELHCFDRGCFYQRGRVQYLNCGDSCVFTPATEPFAGCFLSDTSIKEQLPQHYYRVFHDGYQIILLNATIGNLTGWERGTPECIPCTWDYDPD